MAELAEGGHDDEWMSRDFVQHVLDLCAGTPVDSYRCFSSGVWVLKLKGQPLSTEEPAAPLLALK